MRLSPRGPGVLKRQVKIEAQPEALNPAVQKIFESQSEFMKGPAPAEFIVDEPLAASDLKALAELRFEIGIGEQGGKLILSTGSVGSVTPQDMPNEITDHTLVPRLLKSRRCGHTHPPHHAPAGYHQPSMGDLKFDRAREGDPAFIADSFGIIVYASKHLSAEAIAKFDKRNFSYTTPAPNETEAQFMERNGVILANVAWSDPKMPLLLDWINMKVSWDQTKEQL